MEVTPYITPQDTCLSSLVFIPSDDAEILCFELYTGRMVHRIRGMEQNVNGRVSCVAGRANHCVHQDLWPTDVRNCIQEGLMRKLGSGNQIWYIDL